MQETRQKSAFNGTVRLPLDHEACTQFFSYCKLQGMGPAADSHLNQTQLVSKDLRDMNSLLCLLWELDKLPRPSELAETFPNLRMIELRSLEDLSERDAGSCSFESYFRHKFHLEQRDHYPLPLYEPSLESHYGFITP